MNTNVNAIPENHDNRLITESQLRAFGNAETNQLKTAVTLATAAEIIKTALVDVYQNEVPPSDADILRYLVIESNH